MAKRKGQSAEFVEWFGPLLDALRQLGGSGSPREVSAKIAENLQLSEEQRDEILQSGQNKFHNQVAWARQYLVWEGLLDSSKHGVWALTSKGEEATLSVSQSREIFRKWVKIHAQARKKSETEKARKPALETDEDDSPEAAEAADKTDLLQVLQSLSPHGFEKVCQRLLRESGFEQVVVTGQSRDGGIDGYGTLQINPFVSFKVLFQCKRYKGTVSRAQVGDFRNAMLGRAEKGIIITTGTFSSDAVKEASRDGAPQVELVDGEKLVEMFHRVELGVKPKTVYEVELPFFEPFMK